MALPPDLFDATTLYSLASTLAIVFVGVGLGKALLPATASGTTRFLFVWHAVDALVHVILEGSFLYQAFFSWMPEAEFLAQRGVESLDQLGGNDVTGRNWIYFPTPENYLGTTGRIYGAQAGGNDPFALLWMVYSRADRRWAGADLGVVSLELLTVGFDTLMGILVCVALVRGDHKANVWMVILATAELYGGWMTFCPEWLTGSLNLDTSNFMYFWVYLVLFNSIWVWIPLYILNHAIGNISAAFKALDAKKAQ
ncbi:Emopamil-binding protein-like [Ceratocystis fimbriata CBS 114723]|uniref:Emopamil-binding protein-like n=1 Tax=Ceratocystis fimbriata CBS 114723 TaxID=1035309 RepID=A0A2C5XK67_9PEZI|nr:Emopamil-binding protein-like [Ceratocystis fimbriata CBS 114723]